MYGVNNTKFAEALLNQGKPVGDGSKAVQGYDKDGKLTYIYVDKNNRPIKNNSGENVTLSEENAGYLLVMQSPKRPFIQALFDDDAIDRYQKNTKYGFGVHEDKINKVVEEQVTDKETFLDFAFMPTKGDATLADAIHNVGYKNEVLDIDPEKPTTLAGLFIGALTSIGKPEDYSKENPHPYDIDGDGDFDDDDWGTEANYMKLTKQALSGNDLKLSKILLKTHYNLQAGDIFDNANKVDNPVVNEVNLMEITEQ